ncbi:hypothetical protein T439DRAFT_321332 [Meredithblackwellia eburnea MCA 4105]
MLFPTLLALLVSYFLAFPPAFINNLSFNFSLPNLSPIEPASSLHHPSIPSGKRLSLYPDYDKTMIKVILTGATGIAGSAALIQLLNHPQVTAVTVLSGRPLPEGVAPNPPNQKLKVVLQKDFERYSDELISQLEGYDGVIWDLGKTSIGMNETEYRKIHIDYPLAAAKAFANLGSSEKKFVFTYLSGQGTSQVPGKATQMFGRVKGEAEAALSHLATTTPTLSTYSFRPAIILPLPTSLQKPPLFLRIMHTTLHAVPGMRELADRSAGVADADVLANAMIEAVLRGSGTGGIDGWKGKGEGGDDGTFDNSEILRLGARSVLSRNEDVLREQ